MDVPRPRQTGYGLPCAKCRRYFPGDLEVCPYCGARERVPSVVAPKVLTLPKAEAPTVSMTASAALQREREEFSKQFDSPRFAVPVEVDDSPALSDVADSDPAEEESPALPELEEVQTSAAPVPDTVTLEQERQEYPQQFEPAQFAAAEEIDDSPILSDVGDPDAGEEDSPAVLTSPRVQMLRVVLRSEEEDAAQWETRSNEPAVNYPELAIPRGRRQFDVVTSVLGVVVLACAVLLSGLIVLHLTRTRASADHTHIAKSANGTALRTQEESANPSNAGASSVPTANSTTTDPLPPVGASATSGQKVGTSAVPLVGHAGGISPADSHEEGKEVIGAVPPGPSEKQNAKGSEVEHSSGKPAGAVALSSDAAPSGLLYRVEPVYPEEARRKGIQGPVVLDVHIGKDGAVQDVGLVRGPAVLGDEAITAVKQWRFKPRSVDGHEVETQTTITLRFTIPAR